MQKATSPMKSYSWQSRCFTAFLQPHSISNTSSNTSYSTPETWKMVSESSRDPSWFENHIWLFKRSEIPPPRCWLFRHCLVGPCTSPTPQWAAELEPQGRTGQSKSRLVKRKTKSTALLLPVKISLVMRLSGNSRNLELTSANNYLNPFSNSTLKMQMMHFTCQISSYVIFAICSLF